MHLWTPNRKTVDPVHLCPRCGGISRKHHPSADRRDTRRYFSWHWVCCCNAGCSLNIQVALSGLDSAKCACTDNPVSGSHETNTLSVDGTYQVPFNTTGTPCGTTDRYYLLSRSSGSFGTGTGYSNTSCTGSTTSYTWDEITFEVCTNGACTETVSISVLVSDSGGSFLPVFINEAGGAHGGGLSNEGVCATYWSDGGTATVTNDYS